MKSRREKLAISDRNKVPTRQVLNALKAGTIQETDIPKILATAELFFDSMVITGAVRNKRTKRLGWRKAVNQAFDEFILERDKW